MVGDADPDVGAAKAAGVPCIVVDWGYTETSPRDLGGDALIDDFASLPEVVLRLTATR
jgi:phosphoglycolate phosphatase